MTIVPFIPADEAREAAKEAVVATYAELAVTSNFSFLRGASKPE